MQAIQILYSLNALHAVIAWPRMNEKIASSLSGLSKSKRLSLLRQHKLFTLVRSLYVAETLKRRMAKSEQ